MGTGAFSSLASGSSSVDVVGEGSSFLAVDPTVNSEYVSDGDPVSLNFASSDNSHGSGVKQNSNTVIQPAFTLANQSGEDLFIEINNPLANNDITSGSSGGSAKKGVDLQFLAVPSTPVKDGRFVGIIGRDTLPESSLQGGFDDPGTNEYFPVQEDLLNAGARVPLTKKNSGGGAKAGALKIAAGDSYEVVIHLAVTDDANEGHTSADADFDIEAFDDKSQLSFSDTVNSVFSS
jgi:hypothetical protein